jgi:5-methylcytosine-specific restriction endonuclease McrA
VHVSGKARRRGIDRTRRARRRAGGGLTEAQFYALLRRWKRQRRRCTYCPSLAASVDHVVPLARGGSNREGNLTPACLRCNHAKRDQFVIEWRYADARAAA